ncbi:hypothetical protein, partial [Xanthomonas citri]|uniref:hypothetical protein n=1 Tax=Xanthomonas citri TaxID=346 RepID=UPI003CCFEC92
MLADFFAAPLPAAVLPAAFATLPVTRLLTAFLAALLGDVAASCDGLAEAADARLAGALVTFSAGALAAFLADLPVVFLIGAAAPARASGG